MKKIGFLCLCLASLSIAGCFHIPDEDWLPSRNKLSTGSTQNDDVEKALNSFIDGINVFSTQRNDMKSEKSGGITTETSSENTVEIEDDTTTNNENTDGESGDIVNE